MKLKKSWILIAAVALLLAFAVSGTIAWIAASTEPVENVFTPGKVDTEIVENFDGKVKSSIAVQNRPQPYSTVPVYVRVSVSGYWCDANDKIIDSWDGSISIGTNWFKGSDGFYYYKKAINPSESTTNLLAASIQESKKADGSYLVVNVVHQSIQANPTSVVSTEWPVNVASDGTISKR